MNAIEFLERLAAPVKTVYVSTSIGQLAVVSSLTVEQRGEYESRFFIQEAGVPRVCSKSAYTRKAYICALAFVDDDGKPLAPEARYLNADSVLIEELFSHCKTRYGLGDKTDEKKPLSEPDSNAIQ